MHENPSPFQMEKFKRRARYQLAFLLMAVAFCAILVLNVNSGSTHISLREIARIIFLRAGDETQVSIVWKIRLPRILLSAVLGGALALSGFLLQTFFRNPIAGPFVLGISSGAKMTVAITMIYASAWFGRLSSFALIGAAFAGSLLATGFILLLSRRIGQMSVLLIAGIMIGYICSAATDFLVAFADDADIANLHGWSLGSFSGANWDGVAIAFEVVLTAFALVFLLSKPLGAFQMGEKYARSVGVDIARMRTAIILLSCVLSACVTAFAGPISFVGIAVPFLIKKGLNTAKPIVVIPALFLGGADFCMLSDLIARTAFAPTELSVSTVTAAFGAPVVLFMMLRNRGRLE
jgi:iron complex transport system permease protein